MNPLSAEARLAFLALACLALWGHGYYAGNNHGTAKLDSYVSAQAVQSIKIIDRQGAVTERVLIQYRDRVTKGQTITQTIHDEVVKYVEGKPLALACDLDNRWLRLHDAAARGDLPPAADGTDAAAGGITAAAALPTITENYARAQRNASRLTGLQQWADQQSKVRP